MCYTLCCTLLVTLCYTRCVLWLALFGGGADAVGVCYVNTPAADQCHKHAQGTQGVVARAECHLLSRSRTERSERLGIERQDIFYALTRKKTACQVSPAGSRHVSWVARRSQAQF